MTEYNFTLENISGSAGGSPASILYFNSDRQFNVRGLTNLSGNIVELYSYTPYGKQTILTASGTEINESAYNNCYGFTGRYLDEETGLWYYRARYFDNELGRFISRDPLGFVDGLSLYNGYFAEGFGLDPSGNIFIDAGIDLVSRETFKKWLTEKGKDHSAGGATNVWNKTFIIGLDNIESYEESCCKCSKVNIEIILIGKSYVDWESMFSRKGLEDVIEHEDKRRKTMKLGFNAFFKPIEGEHILCYSQSDLKEKVNFLIGMSEIFYDTYLKAANKIISKENLRNNANIIIINNQQYFDGFKNKEDVEEPIPADQKPIKSLCNQVQF